MIIKGNLDLQNSSIESLDELKEVRGNVNLSFSKNLKDLGNLSKVFSFTAIDCSTLFSLSNLEFISGSLILKGCNNLTNLGKIKSLNYWLNITDCYNLKSLEYIESVNGVLYLKNSGVTEEYIKKYKPQLLKNC